MPLTITPFAADYVPAVKEFNARLVQGGVFHEFQFLESLEAAWLGTDTRRPMYQEYHLAVEDGAVRGGFGIKHQPFRLQDEITDLPFYHSPISEGLFNKKYATVGALLARHAMRAYPLLYALGMGGWQQPLPSMLRAMRWKMIEVPFYFHVCKPFRFLRQIRAARSSPARKLAAETAAWSGAGWLGIRAVQAARRRSPHDGATTAEIVSEFGDWADELWNRAKAEYSLVAVRDREILNTLYPPRNSSFRRLAVKQGAAPVGWAVLLDTAMRGNKYFGDLRVGSIADCFAEPRSAASVVSQATRELQRLGVDLIVSNQSHHAWGRAFESCGYFQGPSNFLFAASPKLAERLEPFDAGRLQMHFTRGDGDGPIHL